MGKKGICLVMNCKKLLKYRGSSLPTEQPNHRDKLKEYEKGINNHTNANVNIARGRQEIL